MNLVANQNTILSRLFSLEHSKPITTQEHSNFDSLQMHYLEDFSMDKFQVKGLPNSMAQLTINQFALRFSGQLSQKQQNDKLSSLAGKLKKFDFKLPIDNAVLEIHVHKNLQTQDLKAELQRVHININKQSLAKLGEKEGYNSDEIQAIADLLLGELERHLFSANHWTFQKWIEVFPYGSQLLGGALYRVVKQAGYTEMSSEYFLACWSISTQEEDFKFIADNVDNSSNIQQPKKTLNAEGIFHLNIKDLNQEQAFLHQQDQEFIIPVGASATESALSLLKEEFPDLSDAHGFTVKVFFTESVFEKYWDMDDVSRSYAKMSKDGNLTIFQNVGFYVTFYDSEDNEITTWTALSQIKVRLSVIDLQRLTYTKGKHRTQLIIRQMYTDNVEVYNPDGELLEQESIIALIGMQRGFKSAMPAANNLIRSTLQHYRLFGYLGDMWVDSPRDQMGFSWIRAHGEVVQDKSWKIVFDAEVDEHFIDPARYESSHTNYFLPWAEEVRNETIKPNPKRVNHDCETAYIFFKLPFYSAWCQEIINENELDQSAHERCIEAWCGIHSQATYMPFFHTKMWHGYHMKIRETVIFGIQVLLFILFFIYIERYKETTADSKKAKRD